jgi:5-deoxy-D-glucuronate isomerase
MAGFRLIKLMAGGRLSKKLENQQAIVVAAHGRGSVCATPLEGN